MHWWKLAGILAVAGCYSESEFVPAKTDAFCNFLLECSEPAVLAFDGMDMEVCQGFWGPRFDDEGEPCRKFKRGLAQQCVQALETATCPTDGTAVDENIPGVCSFVYERCDEPLVPADPAQTEEPPPEPAETI